MSSNAEIAKRLHHFADNIDRWRTEATSLKQLVGRMRDDKAAVDQLVALEETANQIYADVAAFRETVDEIAEKSPEAASQLAGVSDALHLVLLEITELGLKLYEKHSGLPQTADTAVVE